VEPGARRIRHHHINRKFHLEGNFQFVFVFDVFFFQGAPSTMNKSPAVSNPFNLTAAIDSRSNTQVSIDRVEAMQLFVEFYGRDAEQAIMSADNDNINLDNYSNVLAYLNGGY
jgi:hypothetical protein